MFYKYLALSLLLLGMQDSHADDVSSGISRNILEITVPSIVSSYEENLPGRSYCCFLPQFDQNGFRIGVYYSYEVNSLLSIGASLQRREYHADDIDESAESTYISHWESKQTSLTGFVRVAHLFKRVEPYGAAGFGWMHIQAIDDVISINPDGTTHSSNPQGVDSPAFEARGGVAFFPASRFFLGPELNYMVSTHQVHSVGLSIIGGICW